MKKYCKNVDITDRNFIKNSVLQCLRGNKNGSGKMTRRDTLHMFQTYSGVSYNTLEYLAKSGQYNAFNGTIETIVDVIRQEILSQDYHWKPIWHTYRKENDKVRRIGIQDVKQQLYDYIAVNGLKELFDKKIGQFQCAAIPKRGQKYGMEVIKKWIKNHEIRYVWKGDARHYYENINVEKLKNLLKRYVKNDPLLHLTFALIDSFDQGLEIGSYLSQYLANFYMSFAYHYVEENAFKDRKQKNGQVKRKRLVYHQLYYMDDMAFFGKSLSDLKMAVKHFKKWMWEELGIEIKEGDDWIDLKDGYIDMMGFCISREKVTVRSRIFLRCRRGIKKAKKEKVITLKLARRLVSLDGWLKNSDCRHWRKKNKADQIIKICKEVIRDDKNVIRLTTKSGKYRIAA